MSRGSAGLGYWRTYVRTHALMLLDSFPTILQPLKRTLPEPAQSAKPMNARTQLDEVFTTRGLRCPP